ncbi:MAG: hypothetical protein QM817_41130 [Archangium sp.]
MFGLLLAVHIAFGAIALASMAVPLFTVKGSPLHRRAGWVYVGAMTGASCAAFALCALRLLDEKPDNDGFARFLFFVALLTLTSCWNGVRNTRRKTRTEAGGGLNLLMPGLLALGSLVLLGDATVTQNMLSATFGMLGLVLSLRQLRGWLRPPTGPREWQAQHLGSLGAACISTVTAVLVVNAPRLGLGQLGIVVWVLPGLIGGALIVRAQRRLR